MRAVAACLTIGLQVIVKGEWQGPNSAINWSGEDGSGCTGSLWLGCTCPRWVVTSTVVTGKDVELWGETLLGTAAVWLWGMVGNSWRERAVAATRTCPGGAVGHLEGGVKVCGCHCELFDWCLNGDAGLLEKYEFDFVKIGVRAKTGYCDPVVLGCTVRVNGACHNSNLTGWILR